MESPGPNASVRMLYTSWISAGLMERDPAMDSLQSVKELSARGRFAEALKVLGLQDGASADDLRKLGL